MLKKPAELPPTDGKPVRDAGVSRDAEKHKLTPIRGRIDWDGSLKEDSEGSRMLYKDTAGGLHRSVNEFKKKQKEAKAAEQAKAEAQKIDEAKAASEEGKRRAIEDRKDRTAINVKAVSRHFHDNLKRELQVVGLGDIAKKLRYRDGGTLLPDGSPLEAVSIRTKLIDQYGKLQFNPSNETPEETQVKLDSITPPEGNWRRCRDYT